MGCCNSTKPDYYNISINCSGESNYGAVSDFQRRVTFGYEQIARIEPWDRSKVCVPKRKSKPYPEEKYVSKMKKHANLSNGSMLEQSLLEMRKKMRTIKYLQKLFKNFSANINTILKGMCKLLPEKYSSKTASELLEKEVWNDLNHLYEQIWSDFNKKLDS